MRARSMTRLGAGARVTGGLLRRIPSRRVAAEVQTQLRELVSSAHFSRGSGCPRNAI